jgi:hypothetical protein
MGEKIRHGFAAKQWVEGIPRELGNQLWKLMTPGVYPLFMFEVSLYIALAF